MKFNFNTESNNKKTNNVKELSDEIKSFRQKNKEFQATNEHETYLIISFSCKQDKETFSKNIGLSEHTLIDGYELAQKLNLEPKKPSFKLNKPLVNKKVTT